jgi:hypothetical protein
MNDRNTGIDGMGFDGMGFDGMGFDRMARAAHAQSLEALSPRVRAQLQQRRRAAFAAGGAGSSPALHRRHGWAWLGAPALALALAFAAPWQVARDPAPASTLAAGAAAGNAAPATLEQDPDFYLWLASSDAVALASE